MKTYLKEFFFITLTVLILVFGGSSCRKQKTPPPTETLTETVDYPITIISNTIATSLSDNAPLYPVSEDFLQEFIRQANDFEGEPIRTKIDFPNEWGVVCIERLPEGRELWMVQSKSREWIYLVITSGLGTQRILDLIPVAVNLAVQNQNVLETEVWTTRRESDGAFVVEKSYEWIKSVVDVTKTEIENDPSAFQKSYFVMDKYYINEMSRFEHVQQQDSANYNAVVFYYNKENKPEEWDEYIPILQSYCEEKNIYFEEVYSGYSNILIRDYKMNEVAELDITPYISTSDAGMVMFKNGIEPKNVSFGSNERMKVEIKRYFKLLNQ